MGRLLVPCHPVSVGLLMHLVSFCAGSALPGVRYLAAVPVLYRI